MTEVEVEPSGIEGLVVVRVKAVGDERGVIREVFRASTFAEVGLPPGPWQQLNVTSSDHGVVRGLHGEAMTKLVTVVAGAAHGAYVDARQTSASFGQVVTVELVPGTAVLVPNGVCNGFQATAVGETQYVYCFDQEWEPGMSGVAVSAFDPDLGIVWPVPVDPADRARVSAKDAGLPRLADLPS
jgi:dTDP-4-dehydrorhamnose 3,5-epimerase